jgi:hypothetical protein
MPNAPHQWFSVYPTNRLQTVVKFGLRLEADARCDIGRPLIRVLRECLRPFDLGCAKEFVWGETCRGTAISASLIGSEMFASIYSITRRTFHDCNAGTLVFGRVQTPLTNSRARIRKTIARSTLSKQRRPNAARVPSACARATPRRAMVTSHTGPASWTRMPSSSSRLKVPR